MIPHQFVIGVALILVTSCVPKNDTKSTKESPTASGQIRVNQIGYYPNATKQAVVVVGQPQPKFQVLGENDTVLFEGALPPAQKWDLSGETVQVADFSGVTLPGTYRLYIAGIGHSHPFEIKKQIYKEAFLGSIKGLYYQRTSMPLEEKYAGKWHRAMAHPDDRVMFHPSSGKSEGHMASPKGWYDAGDYNKYVVNASFPLGQLLLLEEQYPGTVQDAALNIPESGNGHDDFLDELKYELDWVLTMQDDDGGMFHKLTTKNFEAMVMPEHATNQRYVVGKGTTATLDFAAAAAKAYGVYLPTRPDYAKRCLQAAKNAYQWALKQPAVPFENPADIATGEYGDNDFEDEWYWANAELYVATQDSFYLKKLQQAPMNFEFKAGESWTSYMRFLAYFALLENKTMIPKGFYDTLKAGIIAQADKIALSARSMPYFQPISDFHWGSNSDILNAAMIMVQAYRLKKDIKYLTGVQQSMDYIFGTNALGYSFVTGYGAKPPMHIHHRQSAADNIPEPVPGLLSGGPNSRQQDADHGAVYPKNVAPMKSWVDQEPSFASNEVCLNWNAPLTYVLGFLEQESN